MLNRCGKSNIVKNSKQLKGGAKRSSPVIDSLQGGAYVREEKGCDDISLLNPFPAPYDGHQVVFKEKPKRRGVQVPRVYKSC